MNLNKNVRTSIVLLVITLIINLPLISALEISNVRTEEITENSAMIKWETDEEGDSFVSYGVNKDDLTTLGDASALLNHRLSLTDLTEDTFYYYNVQSEELVDDNNGEFYSFNTPPPDTEVPQFVVNISEIVKGRTLNVEGYTERNAKIRVFVNGLAAGVVVAEVVPQVDKEVEELNQEVENLNLEAYFEFKDLILDEDKINEIRIEVNDPSGNKAVQKFETLSDNKKPVLSLPDIPELLGVSNYMFNATISEECDFEIFVNNKSVSKSSGTVIEEEINLEEGENKIKIVLEDKAGWEVVSTIKTLSDTLAPTVNFELVNGHEYYEGTYISESGKVKSRAQTDIIGETEPGATVYLYIYNARAEEYKVDFERAVEKTIADENGNFKFNNVEFPPPPFSSLKDLAPREVPEGLEEVQIPQLSQISEDSKSYYIYVLAEDSTGKTSSAPSRTVNVNSCYSGNFAFDVTPIPEFQAPYRLSPELMEEGREKIQAVFNLTYRGSYSSYYNLNTNENEPGYRVSNVRFFKACTRNTASNKDYELGCKLLPSSSLSAQSNVDKTAYYVSSNLMAAGDFIDRDDNIWRDFVDKRNLKFPIKVSIDYQERDQQNVWTTKTQVFCYDLGYFVDVPIDTSKLVPDFLANQGIAALSKTIKGIEVVEPYLRTAMLATGIACIGSFLTKMVTRFYRNFMSNFEFFTSKTKPVEDDKKCPNSRDQRTLYIRETVDGWNELNSNSGKTGSLVSDFADKSNSLDERCPQTAQAWRIESYLDQAYRWTCDRFLCRSVPAGWTSGAEEAEVKEVKLKETQCDASANCAFLEPVENCKDRVKESATANPGLPYTPINQIPPVCYLNPQNTYLYIKDTNMPDGEIQYLKAIDAPFAPALATSTNDYRIAAFKPENSDNYCVAAARSCESICKSRSGFQAVKDGYAPTLDFSSMILADKSMKDGKTGVENVVSKSIKDVSEDVNKKNTAGSATAAKTTSSITSSYGAGPCYIETEDKGLLGQTSGAKMTIDKYSAGYTTDCFIDDKNEKYQCVCEPTRKIEPGSRKGSGTRIALKEEDGVAEPWSYRQATIFSESGGSNKECVGGRAGTCYPSWRYYSGRDLSGAFGANYGLDNFKGDDLKSMATTRVDPNKQLLGTFQSVCLPGIYARLQMLKSILVGLRGCIEEAKYTGFHDAGMCKSLFTQYVCGMVYKLISYLGSDCSPLSIKDVSLGGEDSGIKAFFDAGFSAIPDTIDSSIKEVQSDYGNAKLDQFFSSGAQGFSESVCLWAFGYDFPMGADLIMDSAYAFPTNTNIFFPLAERELSTFDPIKGSAVYNYNLGGVVMPGCKIRSYSTELKCVGVEDRNPGINCGQQGCDCRKRTNSKTAFEAERTYNVDGGTGFDIAKGRLFDLPIPSPQKVASNFRYDHVVLHLTLDQGYDPEDCFDEGYRTSNGGVYYFPIQDVSSPGIGTCHVDITSGRFVCPGISSLFAGSQTYLEPPYMQCYDADSGDFIDCESYNLFKLNEQIITKVYLNLDGSQKCLRISDDRNLLEEKTLPLPSGKEGPYAIKIPLGTVTETLLTGGGIVTFNKVSTQDPICGNPVPPGSIDLNQVSATNPFSFIYNCNVAGKCSLNSFSPGTSVDPRSTYSISGNKLVGSGGAELWLTPAEINMLAFTYNGLSFRGLLTPNRLTTGTTSTNTCSYTLQTGAYGSQENVATLGVRLKLLDPGEGGNCYTAITQVPNSNFGSATYTQGIRLQRTDMEVAVASNIHNDFMVGNYDVVFSKVQPLITQGKGGLEGARALFYWISSLVMVDEKDQSDYSVNIKEMLDLFFNGESSRLGLVKIDYYDRSGEYQKIQTYLCNVAEGYGVKSNYAQCGGI